MNNQTQPATATTAVLAHIRFVEFLKDCIGMLPTPAPADMEETHQSLRDLYTDSLWDLRGMVAENFPAGHAA
jgi:hypothetical protein